jgi:hypothetical protein
MQSGQFLVGIAGAVVGVLGWLLVGIYMQRRAHARQARDAGRAVYFEVGANHLAIFMALEYDTYAPLSRATFDRLLPELATWLKASELQALALAYLGHGGYQQVAAAVDLPPQARKAALAALAEAHRVAVQLLRRRVFTQGEIDSLNDHASVQQVQLIEAANRPHA